MAVENLNGVNVITGLQASPQERADPGLAGGNIHAWCETVEVTAGASATSTYYFAQLPSKARVMPGSVIHFDAITPADVDLGVFNVGNATDFTDDPDALLDGTDMSSAGSANIVGDIAQFGDALWQAAGLSEDPNCMMDIKMTVNATATSGGTVTLYLEYTTS
ncbi:MAG: hypothetical protein GY927_14805 [bacterium]|nr:hypothetical protein [bacterium]